MIKIIFLPIALLLSSITLLAQTATLSGTVKLQNNQNAQFVNVYIKGTSIGTTTAENGTFTLKNIPMGEKTIVATFIGFKKEYKKILFKENKTYTLDFLLEEETNMMNDVVITGTMKEMSKLNSPVPVEVYSAKYFENNKSASIFESIQNVNGVRPQLNCSVCNTGDIHINGLEGPYTMVLIDGMPIVSGLSTVYGLTGIPASLIERVEIVKGPASTL